MTLKEGVKKRKNHKEFMNMKGRGYFSNKRSKNRIAN
jgi:hypothetical protein